MINIFTTEAITRSYAFDQAATAMQESGTLATTALVALQALLLDDDDLGHALASESVASVYGRPEFRVGA